ncbi:hypothetical protein EDD37DRAFT_24157 [Exophiala viscosa]|uniref:Zn(2)-C6 fungal-type domain-containing protein n=1 Tax=Exophiala viscosa TaxID=2486360 RepID=A0AAN6DPT1_9EURO|nr:hypothetical protein EDD36DRAFT_322987 [Exophiala viscosa]KAI1628869.1 hypothetical protein EDD37DRAFT_24157 [Exophiala viscosa]
MSQPLAPRPTQNADGTIPVSASHRPRKISTACGACKQRKTRCTGGHPCEACATRRSPCVYDATSDQRRKIANQRNVQELADTQIQLERHKQLLGGMIAIVKAGDYDANSDLNRVIRSGVDLSQLAAHVRNECRSNLAIQQSFDQIEFIIDGPLELPSPTQILSGINTDPPPSTLSRGSGSNSDSSIETQLLSGNPTPDARRS